MTEQMIQKLAIAVAAMDARKISAAELDAYRRLLEKHEKNNYENPCSSLNPSVSKAFKSRR